MTSNPTEIIQQIQNKVAKMIESVTGQQALSLTAYDAEKMVLQDLLTLGASLMAAYYQTRAAAFDVDSVTKPDGTTLPFHSWKPRQQLTIFGDVRIERSYFYQSGVGGYFPLDEAVNLPPELYSDVVQEIHAELAVVQPYRHGHDFLQRWLNLSVSSRAVQAIVTESGESMVAFYEQIPPPVANATAKILVAQADGKGVPLILGTDSSQSVRPKRGQARSRKKEAMVTTVYTQAAYPRSAAEVTASLFHEDTGRTHSQEPPPKPCDKMIWATLEGKEIALTRLQAAVHQREHAGVLHRVALCDGAEALQQQLREKLPNFTLILDFIHAYEYLWKAANALYHEDDPQRLVWVREQTQLLLSGQTTTVIETLQQAAQQSHAPAASLKLQQVANYFERNLPYMAYDECLRQGWPIASGVIEGACRHIVKDRMELSGMRWSQDGAEQLLRLRCVHHNGHWDSFWEYRRAQRLQPNSANRDCSSLPVVA
jgi:hypothetical protein